MKKLLLIGAAFAAVIAPAMAAENPVRVHKRVRPVMVAAPVYSWTGCYIGGNGGYAWNRGCVSSYQDRNTTPDPINGIEGAATIPMPINTIGSGWIGGGQIGCNWQMDRRVVLGIEADIDALRVSGSATTFGPGLDAAYFVSPSNQIGAAGTASETVSLRWLSTIRARAGLPVLADRGLLFLTGGLAMGGVSSSGSVSLIGPGTGPPYATWGGSNSSTQTGWTIGGGFDYALTDHWTTKTEYLYYDFGSTSHPLNLITTNLSIIYPTLGNTVLSSVHGSIFQLLRAGRHEIESVHRPYERDCCHGGESA